MIPKIIHYIWLGGKPLPKIAEKCIESWKKFCPDYEIKRWDESNLDLDFCDYVREAYDNKKYAFASDVLRIQKLIEYGGIYVDIDVKFLKPIDSLLNNYCFTGFESGDLINPGVIFGTVQGNPDLMAILDKYKDRHFIENGTMNLTTICETFTKYYQNFGLQLADKTQELENIKVYASEFFSPINTITNKKKITKNTHTIHLYYASWYSPMQKIKRCMKKVLNAITFGWFGKKMYKSKQKF